VLHAGLRRAVAPRAVLAFSGALIVAEGIAATPPVLLAHGERDEIVPVARSREAARLLRDLGLDVEESYSPLLAHGIDEIGLSAGALFLQRAFAP
jgi:phospholipase/carboxylesterase